MTESQCGCRVCSPDGCGRQAEHTAVGAEATVELCRACYREHRDAALALVESQL